MTVSRYIQNTALGVLIGISMLVPGVSGGTMAVIFGIYDDLLEAVSNIHRQFKKSIFLLSSVALGGLLGFAVAARLISMLLERAYQQTLYFFMGTIIGGVCLLLKQNKKEEKKMNWGMLIVGILIVILMQLIPEDILLYTGDSLMIRFFVLVLIGLLLAAALILPGVSFSLMLVIVGIYTKFISAIEQFDIQYLAPIAFCTLFGMIILTKALYLFMKKYPALCNSLIVGFVIASLAEVYPGFPMGVKLIACMALMALGFALSWLAVIYFNKRKTEKIL